MVTEGDDLRGYIAAADDAGMLNRVKTPVSLRHELADVAAAFERADAGPVMFENPEGSPWPIFAVAVSSRRPAALALGCGPADVMDRMGAALEPSNAVQTKPTSTAYWHDNAVTGDAVDLHALGIPTHSRGDGGAFITGAVSVTRDPISGRGNLSYNRMLRIGRNVMGFNLNEWRDVGTFMRSRDNPEAPFDVALASGLDLAVIHI